ncbi:MAG: hypothetical protein ACI9Y7_002045 [Dokdonia sp.]|jgi:hypothetical protein
MKKLILLILLISCNAYSQSEFSTNTETKEISYSKVFEVDLPKDSLHKKALKWLTLTFKDSRQVIEYNTEDEIIGNGVMSIITVSGKYEVPIDINFRISIAFKAGRYKLGVDNIHAEGGGVSIPFRDYDYLTIDDYKLLINFKVSKKKLQKLYDANLKNQLSLKAQIKEKILLLSNDLNKSIKKDSEDW